MGFWCWVPCWWCLSGAAEAARFGDLLANREATLNPCGMLRRIVQTTAYHRYIADCDEDQARAWLRELEPQPAPQILALVTPQAAVAFGPGDVEVYRVLAHGLMVGGYDPTDLEAYDIVRRQDRNNVLRGWTCERWDAAIAEGLEQRFRPKYIITTELHRETFNWLSGNVAE